MDTEPTSARLVDKTSWILPPTVQTDRQRTDSCARQQSGTPTVSYFHCISGPHSKKKRLSQSCVLFFWQQKRPDDPKKNLSWLQSVLTVDSMSRRLKKCCRITTTACKRVLMQRMQMHSAGRWMGEHYTAKCTMWNEGLNSEFVVWVVCMLLAGFVRKQPKGPLFFTNPVCVWVCRLTTGEELSVASASEQTTVEATFQHSALFFCIFLFSGGIL